MIPQLTKPLGLEGLLATLAEAKGIDIGNPLSVSIGCGKQKKYAPTWEWITSHGDPASPDHYSDLFKLDGFGRYEICRRSQWDAKKKSYQTLDRGEGRFDKFKKHQANKVGAYVLERVRNWHRCAFGNFESYKPTPWM
jgi:hypothetical protein